MRSVSKNFIFLSCGLALFFNSNSVHLLTMNKLNEQACKYSGNTKPRNGEMQLKLLQDEGLQPHHYLCEIGCGALVAGIPIISYLHKEHYVAIEPNQWQILDSLSIPENSVITDEKKPCFLQRTDFDASDTGVLFDYVLAHSIMSHAPLWQLRLFFEKCAGVLKEGGKVLFSIRLTEPNSFSNLPIQKESTTDQWQYPGNTFFKQETVENEAKKWFKHVEYKKHFTAIIVSADRSAFHDWFVLTK